MGSHELHAQRMSLRHERTVGWRSLTVCCTWQVGGEALIATCGNKSTLDTATAAEIAAAYADPGVKKLLDDKDSKLDLDDNAI